MLQLIEKIDKTIYECIYSIHSTPIDIIMFIITSFAAGTVLVILSVLSFCLIKNRKDARNITVNLLIVFLCNTVLKYLIHRPRPQINPLVTETGYSFPSAHTMVGTAFYGFIIYLVQKNIKTRKISNIITVLLVILILLIGISRIYLGVHYASDVIAGFLLGLVYLLIFIKIIRKGEKIE